MAYSEDGNMIYFSGNYSPRDFFQAMNNSYEPIARPTPAASKDYLQTKSFAPWGDNNLFPITIQDAIAASWQVAMCHDVVARNTYGKGLAVVEQAVDENGKEQNKLVLDTKQTEWLRFTNAHKYLLNACYDYWQYGNFSCQYVPTKNYQQVALVRCNDMGDVRYGWRNKNGDIETAFLSTLWNKNPTKDFIAELPVLPEYNWQETFSTKKKRTWVMPAYSYTSGRKYYHELPWHAALKNGVVDISVAFPKLKKSMLQNSMTIKYHVRIDEQYWWDVYGEKEWKSFTAEERKEKRTAKYTEIDGMLTGVNNAFKNLFTPKIFLQRDGREMQFLTIEKIETNPGGEAAFWEDIMAITAQIIGSWGLNAAQIGTVLSDTKSRGGGSDIRESDTSFKNQLYVHRRNILAPLEDAMRFNELLTENQSLIIRDTVQTTLDANPTGQQNIM